MVFLRTETHIFFSKKLRNHLSNCECIKLTWLVRNELNILSNYVPVSQKEALVVFQNQTVFPFIMFFNRKPLIIGIGILRIRDNRYFTIGRRRFCFSWNLERNRVKKVSSFNLIIGITSGFDTIKRLAKFLKCFNCSLVIGSHRF